MDRLPVAETRQRVLNLIEETGSLLGMIPRLLDENEQLRTTGETSQKDNERLREEVATLKGELSQFRKERDEIADTFSKVMTEMVDLMNEMIPKLRPGAKAPAPAGGSPFQQKDDVVPVGSAPRPSPQPAGAPSGFPWKP
jgi:seryl-tRNA synthetase